MVVGWGSVNCSVSVLPDWLSPAPITQSPAISDRHVVQIGSVLRVPSAIYHSYISIGAFCEARNFTMYLDPRQRVVTKNLPPRFCDGRIIKRPDI